MQRSWGGEAETAVPAQEAMSEARTERSRSTRALRRSPDMAVSTVGAHAAGADVQSGIPRSLPQRTASVRPVIG